MSWISSTFRKILLRACCPPWDRDSDSDSENSENSENRDIETGLCFRTASLDYLRLQLDNRMIDCKLVSSHSSDEEVKLWTDICRTVDCLY